MTGFLKNRTSHCQVKKALVRRGRWLLGNLTQFSIIEKLRVPGAFECGLHNLRVSSWSRDSEGSV